MAATIKDRRTLPTMNMRLCDNERGKVIRATNGQIHLTNAPDWDAYLAQMRSEHEVAWRVMNGSPLHARTRPQAVIEAWRGAVKGSENKPASSHSRVPPALRGLVKDAYCVHLLRAQTRRALTRPELCALGAHIRTRAGDLLAVGGFGGMLQVATPFELLENDSAEHWTRNAQHLVRNPRSGGWTLNLGRRWFRDVYLAGTPLLAKTHDRDAPPLFVAATTDAGDNYRVLRHSAETVPAHLGGNGKIRGYYDVDYYRRDEADIVPLPQEEIAARTERATRGW